MHFTFRAKLLASHVALVIAVVALLLAVLDRTLADDLERQLDQRLEEQARGAAQQWGAGEGRRHPDKVAGRLALVIGAEVTLLTARGEVIADAHPESAAAEPPGPEVSAAISAGIGRASRVRAGGEEMHYVAVTAPDGWIVRLAVPLSDINATRRATRARLLVAGALAIVVALGLGSLASRIAAEPLRAMTATARRIADNDFDVELASQSPDEFGMLSRSLASLAAQLKARIGELTAERDRLSAVLAGVAEGVLVLDASGAVLLASPGAAAVLGVAQVTAGAPLAEVGIDARVLEFIEGARERRVTEETEIAAGDAGAGETWIAVYVRPLEPRAGGGVVCVLRDMTPLRRVMTMRRDFLANASHELRTPLAAIQGYAETLLRKETDPATSRKFLEVIDRHARRLGALVDDVLRLSELEQRAALSDRVAREAVDVGDVVLTALETLGERARAAGATVEVAVPPGTTVLADPAALEQVLVNLIDNAVKYGARPGATAHIQVRARREPGGTRPICLEVADQGEGIAAAHLPRLFERFYRVDPSRSRERGGTGLGLAIVQQLVVSLDGTIDVESQAGQGTTFRVHLHAS